MTYPVRPKLTTEDILEITKLYQYGIQAKTIGIAFGLGYQRIAKIVQVIKMTTPQHSPQKIKEDLLNL